jgi:DNA-binding IscR family transcriptional regulator
MAHSERPLTSEELAGFLGTNSVLVRRTLAGLRERGYVSSGKGHGGGWVATADLHQVSLRDIYEAVGSPSFFAMGNRMDNPECFVEKAVNQSLASAFEEAEALLIQRLSSVTLAELSARFNAEYAQHRGGNHDN